MELFGYKRSDGRIGIRNHMLVIPTVNCANEVAQRISNKIPDCKVIPHQHGCAQLKPDAEQTFRTLAGFGTHPNVAGVIIVGLGCETIQAKDLYEAVKASGKPACYVVIQDFGFTAAIEKGTELGMEIYNQVKDTEKVRIDIGDLIVGLECGGSDTTSGISANPTLGEASDILVEKGATVVLSETTESIGAEHILARRAVSEEVGKKVVDIVKRMENRVLEMGVSIMDANPTPGNIKGGLTTIEEKSLGCIHKAGTSKIMEVLEYAERPTVKGLVVMDTPGLDLESVTGLVAGGVQIIVFTTGLGTPSGCPIAPVIKVCGNPITYKRLEEMFDMNVGTIIEGTESIEEASERMLNEIVEVANGKETKAEANGFNGFAINRIGPTM